MSEQNQQNPMDDAQALVNQLSSQQEAPAQQESQPEKVGEIPVAQFNAALKQVAGIDDYQQINELKNYRQQYQELQQKYQEAQTKLNVNPYPNELVENLAKMYQEGADESRVKQYLRIQTMDFNDNPLDVIRQQIQVENPKYTKEMVDDLLEERFGSEPNQEDEQYDYLKKKRDTKIQRAALEAEEFLKGQLANTTNPEAERQRQEREAYQGRLKEAWSTVLNSAPIAPLNFSFDSKDVGGNYQFKFEPPKDPAKEAKVNEILQNFAVQNNIRPTAEGWQQLQAQRENLMWNIYRQEFLEHMARDMYASVRESMVRERAQPKVSQPPVKQVPPRPQPKQSGKFPVPQKGGFV